MCETAKTESRRKRKRRSITDSNPSIPRISLRRWLETEEAPIESSLLDASEARITATEFEQRTTTTSLIDHNPDYAASDNEEITSRTASTSICNYSEDSETGTPQTQDRHDLQRSSTDTENILSYDEDYFYPDMADVEVADLHQVEDEYGDDDNDAGNEQDVPLNYDTTFEPDIPAAEEPVPTGSGTSRGQAIATCIAFILRHNLTGAAVEDLLEMLEILCPGLLPPSKFPLTKGVMPHNGCYNAHLFCPLCDIHLGKYSECEDLDSCQSCSTSVDRDGCMKAGDFFLYMPIQRQLEDLLRRHLLVQKSKEQEHADLTGVFSGRMTKRYVEKGQILDSDITLMWNCDGAHVFSSSKRSVWPLQACVNEIPAGSKDNCILIGLWFANKKPWSHSFLKPFVDELKYLGTAGMDWINDKNQKIHSRVSSVCSSCDSCTRPMLRSTTQFNGKFGCDWCMQEGEVIERGQGTSRVYPQLANNPENRNASDFIKSAVDSNETNPINGIRGVSPLLFLPLFNIVRGFVPDYLHCVFWGVVRMFTGLWFDSSNHQQPWYSAQYASDISRKLTSMRPPSDISRLPRI